MTAIAGGILLIAILAALLSGTINNDCGSSESNNASGTWTWPFEKKIEPSTGQKFGNGRGSFHDGVDISAPYHSNLLAITSGEIIYVGHLSSANGTAVIEKAGDYQIIYQEFGGTKGYGGSVDVKKGDNVQAGQKIGELGHLDGAGSGDHLHLGITKGDAIKGQSSWDKDDGTWLDPEKIIAEGSSSNSSSNIPSSADKNKNAKAIYSYLRTELHATPEAAAGLMGVWDLESGFDPKSVNSSSGATGLAQWLGARLTALNAFANAKGKSKTDLGLQLDFAKQEFQNGYKGATAKDFKITDVHKATKAFLIDYEGMANNPEQWYLDSDGSGGPGRYQRADKWYAKFGNMDPAAGGAGDIAGEEGSTDCGGDDDSSANGDILDIAKGWIGWFYYVQTHPSKDLGSDLKNPAKKGGTDCSGFVWLVLNKAGYKVPKNMGWFTGSMESDAKGDHKYLKEIDKSDAEPGDVVIVNTGSGAGNLGHTAILESKWTGNSTKIIEQGGVGDSVNEGTFGSSFASLLSGGSVTVARPIK
ncbi:CHAP domain-containing protein [Pediococcus pentosaceus]|uniref:phage tail tip lysozyme n=1 Tax=Pediococcus pentosaceus TaxID=1255 RepID=UPI0021A656C8|nr:phage tail tip lysozyme [Pediococcus pentosaceus]MCT3019907.1 CHAP domain-containing protein [Pediococcus pentosaceus]